MSDRDVRESNVCSAAGTRTAPAAGAGAAHPDDAGAPVPGAMQAPSLWALVLANLVPVAGVLLLRWDLGDVMLLFWLESGIIGLFNLLKMARIGQWRVLFFAVFFAVHFGGFMAGHLVFIRALFLSGPEPGRDIPLSGVIMLLYPLWPAILALIVSHAVSYWTNFIGRREYAERTLQAQMMEPYGRIVVMHLTIIFGGFLGMLFETPLPALILLIALKIAADVRAHVKEHALAAPFAFA